MKIESHTKHIHAHANDCLFDPLFHNTAESIRKDHYIIKTTEKNSNEETGNMFRDQAYSPLPKYSI